MRAVIQTGYGSADVMKVAEVEKPSPGDGEVLVRVMAASLAAGEYFGMRGKPFPIRFYIGFPKPKKDFVVGIDCAGTVEAVGPNVTRFRPGDEVYGECRGSCAEYAVAKEGSLASKPPNLSFEQAAGVPTSACTALQALRDHGKVRPGHKVLINGASGGVGTFAVQIAKALGAEVTGVCSTGNVEMVRSIGADYVIDYTKEDFTKGRARYDVVLDNVGSHSLSATRRVLTPNGLHVPSSGHAGMGWIIAASLTGIFVRQQAAPFVAATNTESLLALNEFIKTGDVTPVVDRTYPLGETAGAFAYLDEGHAHGKVVITI
ncbi:MAG: NAD(P)-dependent alcohol dehydrogenase [Actinobacteria bacterium HGW-Actinobacteria-6]|nr:MAG: NAD(P)-dependent alcohol dehydrogenase [Actinobacteria bacterium HGW-Actinobacteria-6]